MGSRGVSELQPELGWGGDNPTPSFAYIFKEWFPYYLAIGMTYDEYWNGDVELTNYYRKAWKLKQKFKNQELWLQGAYMYEALLDASPMLHAFADKNTKPIPYRDEPYDIFGEQDAKRKMIQKNNEKAANELEAWMISVNKKRGG